MPQQLPNFAWSEAEAQARIEVARRDGATALDLSGLRLRTVPLSAIHGKGSSASLAASIRRDRSRARLM